MPITSYADISDTPLVLGQIVHADDNIIRTAYNADSIIIPYGFAIVKLSGNPDPMPAGVPVDGNSVFLGVPILRDVNEKRDSYSVDSDDYFGVPVDYEFSYLVRGVVAVPVDGAVTAGSTSVFWRHTASSPERKGVFRADADTSDAVAVTGARWLSTVTGTAASPAIAKLSLNLA